MNYWLTTQWPQRKGEENKYDLGVWLKDGDEKYGRDIEKGDLVLFYESKTGRSEERSDINGNKIIISCHIGEQGIIKIGEIKTALYPHSKKPRAKYTDGTEAWWRWHAEATLITQSGLVPRCRVSEVLNYKLNYEYKGFGSGHSGLKQISKEQFEKLLTLFRQNLIDKSRKRKVTKRGKIKTKVTKYESKEHRELKHYVAENPSAVLKEDGLLTIGIEYLFPTNDRADIVLKDKWGRIIGVEIELIVSDGDSAGPLQSVKYRRMLEWVFDRHPGDSRSFLVANKISKKIKDKCTKYGIEFFEIKQ